MEQSSSHTESVLEAEVEQKMEVVVEESSRAQVTDLVFEEKESGETVMTVVETESAGAVRFQPSPGGPTARNIPDSLPLEIQPASTHFWTANSARNYRNSSQTL